jgi:hypothetical protein
MAVGSEVIGGHFERAEPAQLDELGGVTGYGPSQLGHAIGQGGAGLAVDFDLLLQLVLEQVVGATFEAVLDGEQPLLGHDVGASQAVEVGDHGVRANASK